MIFGNLFFLQTGSPLAARQNHAFYWILLAALAAIAVFFLASKALSPSNIKKLRGHDTKSKTLDVAKNYGFDEAESRLFVWIVSAFRVDDANFLVQNDKKLDQVFKKAFAAISAKKDRHRQLEILFSIRQKIDAIRRMETVLISTNQLKDGQPIVMVTPEKKQYRTLVAACEPAGIYVARPFDEMGDEVEVRSLSRVGLFFQHGFIDYICMTRLLQTLEFRGKKTLLLNHSNKLTLLRKRVFRRTKLFSAAAAEKVSPHFESPKSKKIAYEKTGQVSADCEMRDISVGGCCFLSESAAFALGDFVALQIDLGGEKKDEIFGRIIRVKESEGEASFHVCFSQVPTPTRNKIYSIVYGYEDAEN